MINAAAKSCKIQVFSEISRPQKWNVRVLKNGKSRANTAIFYGSQCIKKNSVKLFNIGGNMRHAPRTISNCAITPQHRCEEKFSYRGCVFGFTGFMCQRNNV